jgi:DNA-binding MarR family transcriptional regulator
MDTSTLEPPAPEVPSLDELRAQVISMLTEADSAVPRGEIIRRLGRRREVAYVVVNDLIDDGLVVVRRGPRNRADLELAPF